MKRMTVRMRIALLALAAAIICGALLAVGVGLRPTVPESAAWVLLILSAALALALAVANRVLIHRARRRIDAASIAEIHQFLTDHRETDHSGELFAHLVKTRRLTDLVGWGLALSAAGLSFGAGRLFEGPVLVVTVLIGVALLTCALTRLPDMQQHVDESGLPGAEDYPFLYALAEKAQKTVGGSRKIRIDLTTDCNASVLVQGDTVYLILGAVLLSVLTEEELYAVLLHEFGHTCAVTRESEREKRYSIRRNQADGEPVLWWISEVFFSILDAKYSIIWDLYKFSVTLQREYKADQAMLLGGNPKAASSALLKLAFSRFDQWELGDGEQAYAPETVRQDAVHQEIACFRREIAARQAEWISMAELEIQSRSATHPNLRSRLDAMGIDRAELADGTRSEAFEAECEKAATWLDREYARQYGSEEYAEDRRRYYLEPLQEVEKWKQASSPLVAEQVPDLLVDLKLLRRYAELEQLCDRAIAELPIMTSHDAYFWKGYLLLHRYDPEGISYIYQAIEANHNHLDDGLDTIGQFCLLTGRQEELEDYRAQALELAQKDHDVYSHIGELQKEDDLSGEHLPEALLQGLLECVRSVDQGDLEKVYLVHKQITEDFFTSAVILRFRKNADRDQADEVYHQIFRYLDTATDWQFSLFNYENVKKVHVEQIPGSCIYEGKA